MARPLLKNLLPTDTIGLTRRAVSRATLAEAEAIITNVRQQGREAVLQYGHRFSDLGPAGQLVFAEEELHAALKRIPEPERALLERTADRIARFAEAQRRSLEDLEIPIEGGRAGWRYRPVGRAGCYAPGGRFPLPSSVLMTTVTARAAGVEEVWVASPRPGDLILAAAAVGGADALVAAGGAQAVAALAFGVEGVPACDVIVGPGNRYVTAAKQLVSGQVGIDMLAGPSELVILADRTADPATIAADLLAQAEHDPDAVPILVTVVPHLAAEVNRELERQLIDLPTAEIARYALGNGGVVEATGLEQAIELCDHLAPEHLELMVADAGTVAGRLNRYGALFVGAESAEVLGDYGAGPNHVLPTGGTARFSGPLSVQDFLVGRSWLQMDKSTGAAAVAADAVALARLEGLEGHVRSAQKRLGR
jgi:phosphoribosyl-ATP pyrophosphohydrolase/phosphoribosyl-AMP cyclohydrolase/histidinol dehydrogenase